MLYHAGVYTLHTGYKVRVRPSPLLHVLGHLIRYLLQVHAGRRLCFQVNNASYNPTSKWVWSESIKLSQRSLHTSSWSLMVTAALVAAGKVETAFHWRILICPRFHPLPSQCKWAPWELNVAWPSWCQCVRPCLPGLYREYTKQYSLILRAKRKELMNIAE